jgi:hypothetical protein
VARQDPVAGAVMVVYGIAGLAQMALNPRRTVHVLRGGGWYDREIADAERRMAERNAANAQAQARARHVAAARDQEWPSP